jgi:hypothetical protein
LGLWQIIKWARLAARMFNVIPALSLHSSLCKRFLHLSSLQDIPFCSDQNRYHC